ncbi:mannitol-1-phosphate 5-dehydrogenase [Salinibacterium sp. NSLL150]|uniref:mannitol-1-phosphate 5-dehydrogenase n=1 Tax=unclassified Salinibacterium TaxID=2632331 RepID=UPI0018CE543A|nr:MULTISPECIES: mannitol-1-phosphate 5-dehydrogenase [unclassified Salinibacterium]MBH0098254.1 mannitol-1-phosphate 5-dehydrogenase [Salinibacterium sp. NSLL35]MBH0101009.1 mannitol-1-phosphate 5-dehydrogenase [Salinibacterium sp. NSLL150]MBH0103768.1 mannitol-1-phosphate 5-dehydrogenase [Salinibacterium sp. NSLL16]MBH0106529.1 mannitol-1-phosphate 5-dehydrogenase [Salinibacterium sp. NSLL17]
MKAVHFGAGNIGRGFVGLILHKAGYEIVFADVAAELIDSLAAADSYQVHEVGAEPRTETVDNFRALNSASNEAGVIEEIATADMVTTAVGPNILKFVAPLIAQAIKARADDLPPLQVLACENALYATNNLRAEVAVAVDAETLAAKAIFANTAVDRIVPAQDPAAGLDVTVEDFFEWAIESAPFGDNVPDIADVHFVDNLEPYIERKLFTVNTGHATVAYHGYLRGAETLSAAMAIPEVSAEVDAVLAETSAMLIAKHGFDAAEHAAYVATCTRRFSNPHLPDTPERVGRSPLRKLSRNERFISPASELAASGTTPHAILRAVGAAMQFNVPEDPESVRMLELRSSLTAPDFVTEVMGLREGDALYAAAVETVSAQS